MGSMRRKAKWMVRFFTAYGISLPADDGPQFSRSVLERDSSTVNFPCRAWR
jgi:hypothetical protein